MITRKNKMLKITLFTAILFIGLAGTSTYTGATSTIRIQVGRQLRTVNAAKEKDAAAMKKFVILKSKKDVQPEDMLGFMRKNISVLSPKHVSEVILNCENLQRVKIGVLEKGFLKYEFKFADITKDNMNNPKSYKDATLKELIKKTIRNGYKVDTAEGTFYPVIDYSYYKEFSRYATAEIKSYLEIRSVESDKGSREDGGLMIGWDEVVKRAMLTEKFLTNYKNSKKANEIKKMYIQYQSDSMYGLNNTPLFDYNTKVMMKEARTAYEKVLKNKEAGKSMFLVELRGFMKVCKKNNYKLTDEVDQYRKNIN